MTDLEEGDEHLGKAFAAGEQIIPETARPGHNRIRQDIQTMTQELEDFRTQLHSTETSLKNCLARWQDYDDAFEKFSTWLRETGAFLQEELEPRDSLEAKQKHVEEYQVNLLLCFEIIIFSGSLQGLCVIFTLAY